MKKLDRHTVKAVELTAPGACRRDADQLHNDLTKGRIFGAFTEQERAAIWIELLAASTDRLIPSLFTFFEDARYLRGPAGYMKRLMKLSNDDQVSRTLKHRFTGANQRIDTCMVQVSESQLEARPGNLHDQLGLGCRQMWIMMMRSDEKSVLSNWKNLGHLLGFETHQIQTFARDSADRDIGPDPESSCHDKQLKRCGIPRRGDQWHDKTLLFADALHGTIDSSAGVTSFFVRRSVYLAFFGVPRFTATENRVLYQVSISSTRQIDQTEQLPDTQMAELEQIERAERIAQEDADRGEQQQEMQQHQDHEQMRLAQIAQDLGQERNKLRQLQQETKQHQDFEDARLAKLTQDAGQESNRLSRLRQELDTRQKEQSKEQFRLDQLSQSLEAQQEQRHTEWDKGQQSKEQQQQRIDQLAQDLGAKDVENQQKQEELQKEQHKLDQQQEIQGQLAQDLAIKEVENQQRQEEVQKEQHKLDQQQESQGQLAQDLAIKEVENQQRQEEVQEVQKRLDQQQESQGQLAHDLAIKEVENQQRQERMRKEQQNLDQQQEEQEQLAQDLETQRKVHQSEKDKQNQRQQALEQKERVLVANDSLFAQEIEHEHDQMELVVLEQNQQEQEVGELTDHWREEHKKRLPAVKSKTKKATGTSRVDNHSLKQDRPVTQIGLGKRSNIKAVDRDIAIQSKKERQVLKEPNPEPEIRNLTRPTLDNTIVEQDELDLLGEHRLKRVQANLESDENEDMHNLTSWMRKKPRLSEISSSHQVDRTHITEWIPPNDTAAVRPVDAIPGPGQKRKEPGITKQWESASKNEERTHIRSRRITQLGILAQQQGIVSGQSVQRQPEASSAALPVLITFKTYNGETWVVKQIVQTNVDDPEPVRRAAERYQSDAMKLYDSHNRVLSIETCMEDVLQDRTKTIFLFPTGSKIPSSSKPSETIDLQSGEESL
jgi:myosin heavy subunit